MTNHNTTFICTLSGTLLSMLAQETHDALKTMLLAALGATVSFFVSGFLKRLNKKIPPK